MVNGELKHFGVKGMKWGVRRDSTPKKTKSVGVSLNSSKKKFSFDGTVLPLPAAAVVGTGMAINQVRTKRKIAREMGYKASELNPKQLDTAAKVVRRFKDVTITIDGKTYNPAKATKKEKLQAITEGRERRRNEKVESSARRTKIESKAEAAHNKNMKRRQYEIDYNYYRALGQSHSTARTNASLEKTATYIEMGRELTSTWNARKQ